MCLQKRTSNSRNMTGDNAEKRINGGDKTAAEFWYWCLSERRSSRYRETSVPGMLNVHPPITRSSALKSPAGPSLNLARIRTQLGIKFDIERIGFGIGMQLHVSFCLTNFAATSGRCGRRAELIAVGTPVTQRPPHGSGLALISASGSYRGCLASKRKWG